MTATTTSRIRILVLGAAVGLITIAHHVTPLEFGSFHNVYQRLYYLPIFAGGYWFGVRGALAVSILSAASYLPHIVLDWAEHPAYREAQYGELLMFQVVGLVVGTLVEAERRQRARQERTARELADAYGQLRESFEQLRRADRLTALGELSAGLAHEIKNPLASMKGSLEILASDFPPGHEKREFLEIFDKELDRLNGVLSEFLQFARPPRPDRRLCQLNDVMDSLTVLCSKEAAKRGVRIEISCPQDLPELPLDAGQIQQALLNIVLNGIQAMPSGGCLNIHVTESAASVHVRIRDEGPGITAADRPRIFDPFFTTKDGGTGLGMAIAHKLIHGHGGEIQLLDQEGPGATFLIVLPIGSSHQ